MAKNIVYTDPLRPDLLKFINSRHILTLATSENNEPYCANCFYAFHQTDQVFIFTSDKDTRHIDECIKNKKIAGTIYLDTRIIGKIRGIQFTGSIYEATKENYMKYKITYLKKFPFSVVALSDLWFIIPDFIKFTDNRLGFGTKLVWPPMK